MNVTRAINGESNITGNHSFHPITKTAFLGSTWGTCLVAAILFAVRLRLRRRDHRYLVFDDFFVLIAFICLVSNQAILTISASDIFSFEQVRLHWTALTENDSRHASYFLKCTFSMNILYCGTIWSSKAGLLLLFRRVYPSSRWSVFIWVSFGIVFATFLLSVVLYSLACTRFTRGGCASHKSIHVSFIRIRAVNIGNIITDLLLIMVLFISMWRLQPPFPWHIVLAFISSMTVGGCLVSIPIIRMRLSGPYLSYDGISPLELFFNAIEATGLCLLYNIAHFQVYLWKKAVHQTTYKNSTPDFPGGPAINHPGKLFTRNPNTIESDEDLLDRMRIELGRVRTNVTTLSAEERASRGTLQQNRTGILVSTEVNQASTSNIVDEQSRGVEEDRFKLNSSCTERQTSSNTSGRGHGWNESRW